MAEEDFRKLGFNEKTESTHDSAFQETNSK